MHKIFWSRKALIIFWSVYPLRVYQAFTKTFSSQEWRLKKNWRMPGIKLVIVKVSVSKHWAVESVGFYGHFSHKYLKIRPLPPEKHKGTLPLRAPQLHPCFQMHVRTVASWLVMVCSAGVLMVSNRTHAACSCQKNSLSVIRLVKSAGWNSPSRIIVMNASRVTRVVWMLYTTVRRRTDRVNAALERVETCH